METLQPQGNQSTANHFTGICMPSSVSCQLPALLSSPAATHPAMQLHAPSPNVFTGLQCHTRTYGKTLKPQVCTLTTRAPTTINAPALGPAVTAISALQYYVCLQLPASTTQAPEDGSYT